MNVLYFTNCRSIDEVEKTKEKMYAMFGLNSVSKDGFPRKAVDEEYRQIRKYFESMERSKSSAKEELVLDDVLAKIREWDCEAEICGQWLWLSGRNIYSRFNDLKALGFRYAKNKKAWYWRPEGAKSSNQEPMPMEFIREKYGSDKVALTS